MSERLNPRLSLTQFANYMVSYAGQRRRIIRDAKKPPAYMINWYDYARQAINKFISDGMVNEAILTDEIERLSSLPPLNASEESRYRTNAQALESVLDSYNKLTDFDGFSFEIAAGNFRNVVTNGVEISVRPEAIVNGLHRGKKVVGALKLYFSKDDPLNNDSASYITSLIMRYVHENLEGNDVIARGSICIVYDIFRKEIYSAPASVTRRFQDVEAACLEIALLWPTV